MRKCPFCHEDNPIDASSCRYCGRILIERTWSIFESEYSSTKRKVTAKKYSKNYNIVTLILSFLKRFKWVVGFFVVVWVISWINSISGNKYQQEISSAVSTISSHVKSIAEYQWVETNSAGIEHESYLYDNAKLNITLFYDTLTNIKNIYSRASTEWKIKWGDQATFVRYYKTIYFFSLEEIINRAYTNMDSETIGRYKNEAKLLKNDSLIMPYIDITIFNSRLTALERVKHRLDLSLRLDTLEKDIDYCQSSCSVDRYNALVREYNGLLPDFNGSKDALQDFFETTMELIDVSVLFPTQDHMDLVNTK